MDSKKDASINSPTSTLSEYQDKRELCSPSVSDRASSEENTNSSDEYGLTENPSSEFFAEEILADRRIKRVTLSGGGAKGSTYSGAQRAMSDTQILSGVKQVSGASAGAIMSAFIACGTPSWYLREISLRTNYSHLIGNFDYLKSMPQNFATSIGKKIPFLRNHLADSISQPKPDLGECIITRDGKKLEEFIRHNIVMSVKMNLYALKIQKKIPLNNQELTETIQKIESLQPEITFSDLALLAKIFPETFKELTVTAVKHPHGELEVFNATNTPSVEIALACRASASLPAVLKPVDIFVAGKMQKYIDGGYAVNVPFNCFDQDEDGKFIPNIMPTNTLLFSFAGKKLEESPIFQAQHKPIWDTYLADLWTDIAELINDDVVALINKNTAATAKATITEKLTTAYSKHVAEYVYSLINAGIEKKTPFVVHFTAYDNTKTSLEQYLRNTSTPILYNPSTATKYIEDELVQSLADMQTPYKHSAKEEEEYQKIRSQFALRSVALHVGDIETTDFEKATKLARPLDALGYLDTLNYLCQHNLCEENDAFFKSLLHNTLAIYKSLLISSGTELKSDALITEYQRMTAELREKKLHPSAVVRTLLHFIKDTVELDLAGPLSFALSRALELQTNINSKEMIQAEVYQRHQGNQNSRFSFFHTKVSFEAVNQALNTIQEPEKPQYSQVDAVTNVWQELQISLQMMQKSANSQPLAIKSQIQGLINEINEASNKSDIDIESQLLLSVKIGQLLSLTKSSLLLFNQANEVGRQFWNFIYEMQRFQLKQPVNTLTTSAIQHDDKAEIPALDALSDYANSLYKDPYESNVVQLQRDFRGYQENVANIPSHPAQMVNQLLSISKFAKEQLHVHKALNCVIKIRELLQQLDPKKTKPPVSGLLEFHKEDLLKFLIGDGIELLSPDDFKTLSEHKKTLMNLSKQLTQQPYRKEAELLDSIVGNLSDIKREIMQINTLIFDKEGPSNFRQGL